MDGSKIALCLLLGLAACKAEVKIQEPPPPPPAPAPPPPAPAPLEQIVINDRIEFETGKDKLLNESLPVLDVVVKLLNKKPHIELVEIHGHTDDTGDDMRNIRLSEARATAIRMYLIGQGIDGKRLVPRGFGARQPLAPNDTPENRKKNRRVEFRVVKQRPAGT